MYLDCIIFIDTIFKYVIMYTNINTVRNGGKRMKKLLLISFTILILLLTNVSANELDSSCKSVDYELMEKTEHFLNQFEDDHYFTDQDVYDYYEFIGQKVDDVKDETITTYRSYTSYFYWSKWISRDGRWSLSIMPKDVYLIKQNTYDAWTYIYNRHSNSNYWRRYNHDVDSSMNRQFACHVVYGALKTPWNLEPHKRVEDLNPFTCN